MNSALTGFVSVAYGGITHAQGYEDAIRRICELLGKHTEAAVLLLSAAGDVAAYCNSGAFGNRAHDDKQLLAKFAAAQQAGAMPIAGLADCGVAIVVPVVFGTERLGTLAARRWHEFSEESLVVCQAAALILAASMMAIESECRAAATKGAAAVRAALGTLSYSELVAVVEVMRRLPASEGIVIAASVSAESKVTRAAIVNALRKLESAGLLESHSMGVKGTYIKLQTAALRDELKKFGK